MEHWSDISYAITHGQDEAHPGSGVKYMSYDDVGAKLYLSLVAPVDPSIGRLNKTAQEIFNVDVSWWGFVCGSNAHNVVEANETF